MLNIGNLVKIDEQAEFRNDVQISAYDEPQRNLALLRSYLFTSAAPGDQHPSVGLLEVLLQAFLSERLENRYVAIANYGHGKSHLALALANYFGKPTQSDETKLIMEKIANAVHDEAKASRYRDFKHSKGEFLVIRLRGDVLRSLREQFPAALEKALGEHVATANVELPFWSADAAKFLRGLKNDDLQRANDFLKGYRLDIPLLLQEVQERRVEALDRCVELVQHLYNLPSNFGGHIILQQAVQWAVEQFCGQGKPFAGILILFDEFSQYVQNYARSALSGELQDLLNGVDDHRGKVIFLAFAQHDPLTVAENILGAGQTLDSVKRELTRLPKKLHLYSLMESVIDAYLQPARKDGWEEFNREQKVRGSLARATDVTFELYKKRYQQTLKWSIEKYQETVTRGCFPLHPLSTALLCNLRFQEATAMAGTPRTVLGFVMEQLERLQDTPAYEDGKMNWVLPITLVDYFEERLAGDRYRVYDNARRSIGADAPYEQKQVLKSLFLQDIAELAATGSDQVDMLVEMTGLPEQKVRSVLTVLRDAHAVRYDPLHKAYSFWPLTTDPQKLERLIQKKIVANGLSWGTIHATSQTYLDSIEVSVEWGAPVDWAANQKLMVKDFLDVDTLRSILPPYALTARGIQEGGRGSLIWLLARDESDRDWYRQQAVKILDDAFPGSTPPPIAMALPSHLSPELVDALQREQALKSFTQPERDEVGIDVYNYEIAQVQDKIKKYLERVQIGKSFLGLERPVAVPSVYQAAIQAMNRPALRDILDRCYDLAYPYSPPEFETVLKASATKLKNDTRMVCGVLLRNNMSSNQAAVTANPIAKKMRDKFLRGPWQILTPDDRIREPGSHRIRQAWDLLESSFAPGSGEIQVRDTIVKLFNPPYGYDYNSAVLIFSAWFGFHAHDLQISANGTVHGIDELTNWMEKGPKDFVYQICITENVALSRRNPEEELEQVRRLIEQVKSSTFTQPQARLILSQLCEYHERETNDPTWREHAKQSADNLADALHSAEEYDRLANQVATSLRKDDNLRSLLSLQQDIQKLPRPSSVSATAPQPAELRQQLSERLTRIIDEQCQALETLSNLTQLELKRQQIRTLKGEIEKAGMADLGTRLTKAAHALDQNAKRLEVREKEAAVRAEIQGMDSNASLKTLYTHRERLGKIGSGYSDELMKLCNQRLQAIQGQIDQLEQFANGLQDAVNRLDSLQAINTWRDRLLQVSGRYEGTAYATTLESAAEQAGQMREFIQVLAGLSRQSIATQEQATEQRQQIESLAAQSVAWPDGIHREMLDQARQRIEQQIQQKMDEARRWIRAREEELKQGKPTLQIREKLEQPPAFLPADEQDCLGALRTETQMRVDLDAVSKIEIQFRQIADPDKRRECLARLQQIMDQEYTTQNNG